MTQLGNVYRWALFRVNQTIRFKTVLLDTLQHMYINIKFVFQIRETFPVQRLGYTAREKFRCMQLWSLYVFLYHRIINFKGNWHSELRDKHTSFNQVFIIKIKKMDEWKRRAKGLYKEDSEKLKYRQIWLLFLNHWKQCLFT